MTPIIMEADLGAVAAKMLALKEKQRDKVHIDISDGLFCDYLSIAPSDLQEIDTANMKIDFHLLVDDPTEWIEECIALNPRRIIGQVERMGSQAIFIKTIESYKGEAGLALEIGTPVDAIEKEALQKAKVILLLAVPSGTHGSDFDERVIEKIKELKKVYQGAILIDGGMNKTTQQKVMEAGATEIAANSAYWRGEWDTNI